MKYRNIPIRTSYAYWTNAASDYFFDLTPVEYNILKGKVAKSFEEALNILCNSMSYRLVSIYKGYRDGGDEHMFGIFEVYEEKPGITV